jgi:hypothetical protein
LSFASKHRETELFQRKVISHHFPQLLLVNASIFLNIDIASTLCKEGVRSGQRAQRLFFESASYFNVKSPFFDNALILSLTGITADQNYISLHQQLRRIGHLHPEKATDLLELFKQDETKNIFFIPFLIQGLVAGKGFASVFDSISDWCRHGNRPLRLTGIRSIAYLQGATNYLSGFEERIEELFSVVVNESNEELTSEVLQAIGLHLDYLPSAAKLICDIPAKEPLPRILTCLAGLLWVHSEKRYNEKWFASSLQLLTCFDQTLRGVFNNLDMAFFGIEQADPEIVYNYLEAYIGHEQNDPTAIEGFKHSILRLAQRNPTRVLVALTKWFNHDSYRFHAAAHTLCSILWVNNYKEIFLDKDMLDQFSFYDIEFILFKIAGYVISKDHLQSLVFSSLKRKLVSAQHFQLVVELFVRYVVYNYPGAIDYLESKREGASGIETQLIDTVKAEVDAYHSSRSAKPNELHPSSERLKLFLSKQIQAFDRQNKRGRFPDPSILDFVTNIRVQKGHFFFSRNERTFGPGQYTEKSSMKTMAMNIDMPAGEFTDPVGQSYNRLRWRSLKRRTA